MSDPVIIPPDPRLVELSKNIAERKKRERKKQEWHDHRFEIYHAVLTTIAILISAAALIVSIISLRVQINRLEESSQGKPEIETVETKSKDG